MNKSILSILGVIFAITMLCIILFFTFSKLSAKKNIDKEERKSKQGEILRISQTNLSNYEIAKNTKGELFKFYVDFNGDDKKEIICVYRDIGKDGERQLPIMVKIFSGDTDHLKMEFSCEVHANECKIAEVLPNFWGDTRTGRDRGRFLAF